MKFYTQIKRQRSLLSNQSGFSIAEIVIVLGIIGGILAFILPKITEGNIKAKVNKSKMIMSEISIKLDEYNSECGKYPSSLSFITDDDGSCKNWNGNPKMKHLLKDGFGTDFVYEASGTGYNLKSLGADKKEGGSSYDKDIYSDGSLGGE